MKKFLTLVLLLYGVVSYAQQYNNEWIDYTKTYYKFKTNRTGLMRIPASTLTAVGLGTVPAEQFKLWRNGQELSLYTSVASGVMPSDGYIEFWASTNDGVPDKPLYRNPAYQHTDKVSLQSDTAAYFLTVDPSSINQRFATVANNVAANVLPPEPYFMYTAGGYYREQINGGFAAVIGEYVYSSSYDKGEYWSSNDIYPSSPRTDILSNLFVYGGGPAAQVKFGASGNALNTRTIRLTINNTVVKDTVCDFFNDVVATAQLPSSLLGSGNVSFVFSNNSTALPVAENDRMVISYYELTYPRQFNFGGAPAFNFSLAPTSVGYYLEISSFNYGTTAPVLYDFTNHQKFVGDISTPGLVRFALPASSTARNLTLTNQEAGNYVTVAPTDLAVRNFIDFSNVANQGNYIIVSNPALYHADNGSNPVEDYRAYRSSATGGAFTAKTYDIDELVDQFAFGIKKHPLSIKNFLRFARAKFNLTPKYALLIGHGVSYNVYRYNQSDPICERLNLVPTFGWPASDNLLSSADGASPVAITPIGRLSAVSADEVGNYFQKVKEYESAQQTNPNTIDGRAWMKNVMQITGASEVYLGSVLCNYMDNYKALIDDTLIGANVTTFCKSTSTEVEQISNDRVTQLFEQGLGLFTYFGHSSSSVLGFNIDDPQNYNNAGKYPFFSVNGCNAGDFFVFDPIRFTFGQTLSEKFTFAKERGSIGFLASTHFGIVNYLNLYITALYKLMNSADYGKSVGELSRDAGAQLMQLSGNGDYYARLSAEEMTLHGDPAIKTNYQALPDYDIEEPQVVINPQFVSVAENKFTANIKLYNLGKVVTDSIVVEIKRQYPDNSVVVLLRKKIPGIRYTDSLSLDVPIVATRDKGSNKLIIKVDADDVVPEITETNNSLTKEFFIYEDEARPAYPYDFAIINKPTNLFASTANPLSSLKQYAMEMDTTELFNSPAKVSKTITSVGGLLEFAPGVTFQDSTVYYWRTSLVPPTGGDYHWNESSFIYLPASSPGFNQSHYYQHLKSGVDRISLGADRIWRFGSVLNNLFVRNTVYPVATEDQDYSVSINGDAIIQSGCVGYSLIFNVIDPVTFKPWKNVDALGNNLNIGGSGSANCQSTRNYNFEWRYLDAGNRKKMMDFMANIIPDGYYVVVRNITNTSQPNSGYVNDWKADTSLYGSGNSLYNSLVNAGLAELDSFYHLSTFAFIYKKNDPSFVPKYKMSLGATDRIILSADCPTPDSIGFVTSPVFGPAKAWKTVHWRGSSQEANSPDNPTVEVIGVTPAGIETPLYVLDQTQQDFDVSGVSAAQYPNIKLYLRNSDSIKLTPYQLKYWRIDYDPVPEGAVVPNIYFKTKDVTKPADTLDIGDKFSFGLAFKNISPPSFDSLRIKMYILDGNNVTHAITMPKRKPLIAGDSIQVNFDIDTKDYPGANTIYVEFNPDDDQPEQYHFNNFVYRNFYVRADKTNPLLDVTFDNVHILNRDIVSAKPHIQIKLKDEAKFLLLTDTSMLTLQVKYPDNTLRTYKFNTDTLRFTPAVSGSDNTATIDFTPAFLDQINANGDEYQLIVKGKDASGNKAGATQYTITFRVISKPMISNLLNYPNPFTTSTAFVFTITGTDIPENMKIQILTITGKVVREITKQELGPLHIGRNITDYKWDGMDQFGQRLGNGVYLYRFVTTLNGKKMDKFTDRGDNTDKFFTQGYGKMYLMK